MVNGMTIVTRGHAAGFTLVLILHLAVLYAVLQQRSAKENIPDTRYSRLLFIVAPQPAKAVETPRPPAIQSGPRSAKVSAASIRNRRLIPAPPPVSAPVEMPASDPFNEPARLDIDSLVRQAGKADRDTRALNERQVYGPAQDSVEAVMTRAFNEAKLAVPLKWYEAARIELFSAPNDPRKIYQVKTAFGTYCLFYPSIHEDHGGSSSAGQPKVSSCPKRFGAGKR
jgi:hypothetical protein